MASLILLLLVLHFIGDFVLQPRCVAEGKSQSLGLLLVHGYLVLSAFYLGLIVTGIWFEFPVKMTFDNIVIFAFLVTTLHCLQDFLVWRIYKIVKGVGIQRSPGRLNFYYKALDQKFMYWKDYWFYTFIGFDQLLHAAVIILCLPLLGVTL